MTAIQAAERQAMLASIRANIFRRETIAAVEDVLKRMDTMHTLNAFAQGQLKADAFCALTSLQTDMRLKFDYSGDWQ